MLSADSFRLWRERHRSRQGAEPVDQHDAHDHDIEQPSPSSNTNNNDESNSTRRIHHTESGVTVESVNFNEEDEDDDTTEEQQQPPNNSSEEHRASDAATNNNTQDQGITISLENRPRLEEIGLISETDDDEDSTNVNEIDSDEQEEGQRRMSALERLRRHRSRNDMTSTVTLVELEEERELARRRSSACVMLCLFVLVRMWFEAILEGDFGLFLVCSVLTSWAIRWNRYNRDREEELDRRIQEYWNTTNNRNNGDNNDNNDTSNTAEMPRSDLAMLSFQAQLALAIMESQRQVMQGGFGHPDGEHSNSTGVTDEQKESWKRTKFVPDPNKQSDIKNVDEDDEEYTCSICLCEYESNEIIVTLPCGHVYHDDCVSSWTSNHIRCPLCNYDLTSVEETCAAESEQQEQQHDDSIV
mmetsp:Transcript_8148/g.11737  ORF Transcript_8148/g.11737 Transcript_8148/m.11737 type:complete len:414 (-) Transcript_8148:40-1281(-)